MEERSSLTSRRRKGADGGEIRCYPLNRTEPRYSEKQAQAKARRAPNTRELNLARSNRLREVHSHSYEERSGGGIGRRLPEFKDYYDSWKHLSTSLKQAWLCEVQILARFSLLTKASSRDVKPGASITTTTMPEVVEPLVPFEETDGFKQVNVEYKTDVDSQYSTSLIREKGAEFINLLNGYQKSGKDGRLISLAKTAIEEAVMWAIKAIHK